MLELTPKLDIGQYIEVFDGQDRVLAELVAEEIEMFKDYVGEAKERYVEIGVKRGGSALLARALNPNAEVWGIDKTDASYELGHRKDINVIFKSSLEAVKEWDKPIDVLFIDGNHEEAKEDFDAWNKFVVKDGIIIFHDYALTCPKVIKDCDKIMTEHSDYILEYKPYIKKNKERCFIIRKTK